MGFTNRRRGQLTSIYSEFSPDGLSAVCGWLRVANATVTGSGVSSLPDMLNPASPAIQTNDALRPPRGTAANGLPILQFTSHVLLHPLTSGCNNASVSFGIGLWLRSPMSAANRFPYRISVVGSAASARRLECMIGSGENVQTDFFIDADTTRRGNSAASLIGNNTWQFVTWEFEGAKLADARFILTNNNSGVSLTYSSAGADPTATEMPATLVTPTGNATLGAESTTPGSSTFTGDMGPNIYFFNRQLTSAERLALMGFEQPT